MMRPDDDPPDPRTAELLRGAPRELRPRRDLWPGIESRLRRRRVPRALPWALGLAAAAGVAFVLLHRPPVRDEVQVTAESRELVATLTAITGTRSATARSLAHHLAIIDAAIAETKAALDETPADPALVDFLQDLDRRRLALLAQAARFAAES